MKLFNIYQIYHFDNKLNFYVKRYTWENTIAKVIFINGVVEGKKITGKPPYYGTPLVMAEFYKVIILEDGSLEGEFMNEGILQCSGNYSWNKLILNEIIHEISSINEQ